MILQKIKLSGFKSFVEPTNIPFPSCLVGVVGPNGCGKSNVIDAVRWVMGESAASRLRGGSLTDVIFSGSSQRQPAGQAAVELVFTNTGTHTHPSLAAYPEIAIRREVTRDGQSNYYLNNTRCRRKDIADIFLGTGLGPRSYSIIQQGTVSQIIEAKPEELRQFLEEAAGISKYKERRKETSTRIRHTRENLARLNDVRSELEQQLAHLQRQAQAAEKFKQLKREQRSAIGELHGLKWSALKQKIDTATQNISNQETALAQKTAEVRSVEARIEQVKLSHHESVEVFNQVQAQYYQVGGEIGRLEQTLKHQKERKQQLSFDFDKAQNHWEQLQQTLTQDQTEMAQLAEQLAILTPKHESADTALAEQKEQLNQAEQALTEWRTEWDAFNNLASTASKQAEVEQVSIRQYEQRLLKLTNTQERLATELANINVQPVQQEIAELATQLATAQAAVEQSAELIADTKQAISSESAQLQSSTQQIDQLKQQLQQNQGRKASLEALQESALGQKDHATQQWLSNQQLQQATRLAQAIDVAPGWESAIEVVLGDYLQAVCVKQNPSAFAEELSQLSAGQLTLINSNIELDHVDSTYSDLNSELNNATAVADSSVLTVPKLSSKITSQQLLPQIADIYAAENLTQALALIQSPEFAAHYSVITPEGIWLSKHWIRVSKTNDHQSGVLQRERELTELSQCIEQQQNQLEQQQTRYQQLEQLLAQYQEKLSALTDQHNQQQRQVTQREADLRVKRNQHEQAARRIDVLQQEQSEYQQEQQQLTDTLAQSRETWHQALAQLEQYDEQRAQLDAQRDITHGAVTEAKTALAMTQQQAHQVAIEWQATQTKHDALTQTIQRLNQQFDHLTERKAQLAESIAESDNPETELSDKLAQYLEQRVSVETELNQARQNMNDLAEQLNQLEQDRHGAEQAVQNERTGLESARLEIEGYNVRQQTITEQLAEMDLAPEQLLASMTGEQSIEQLEAHLAQLERRIQRLGAINLAAIDEHKEKSERKTYLDEQNADLESALATLESAMHKIDKETRVKFKETYDTVNQSFKQLFPKIFGGGSASLELTGTDLLDTGVEVFARPPGKKNATIHLLSGGEKTMTAIALVFSIFQLNPSPFCMLDEVDAPLDDANVVRFCELVKEMSNKVQFVVITHNKVTMEMMHQLMGVTMHEPGVSRIVSVDVEAASELVEES